jgi:hypothetical protein
MKEIEGQVGKERKNNSRHFVYDLVSNCCVNWKRFGNLITGWTIMSFPYLQVAVSKGFSSFSGFKSTSSCVTFGRSSDDLALRVAAQTAVVCSYFPIRDSFDFSCPFLACLAPKCKLTRTTIVKL